MSSFSSFEHSESEGGGYGNGNGADSKTNNDLKFQRKSTTIASSIQKIHQNVSTMHRMVSQMGTAQDSPDLKSQLTQLRTYTQQLIKDTDALLQELVIENDRHLKIQRERLVDEFTAALTAFQSVQKRTVDMEKSIYKAAKSQTVRIAKPPGSKSGSNNSQRSMFDDNFGGSGGGGGGGGSGSGSGNNSRGQTQAQLQQEEIDMQALQDQERSIRELEENIVGVNDIYKKLGALVYEQGMTVDSIESSVENTNVFVHEGTEQLRQASHYQNKLRKKKLCLGLIAAAVLAILITIIVYQFK